MNQNAKEILRQITSWPEEDQEELAAVAREIEARRTGVYALTEDERVAITEARQGGFASDQDIVTFWKRHGIA